MTLMKTSVVIASYNGSAYLAEQLKSICEQTPAPDEIIISDDNSSDLTCAIAENFAGLYPDIAIKFSVNPSPSGVDKNFERAISLASGDIIFICDQDDVWFPERIKIMTEALNRKYSATFCDSLIVDRELNSLGYTHLQSRGFPAYGKLFPARPEDFLKRVPPAGHDMAFTADLKDVLLPFPELKNCYDTWIGLVFFALGVWKPCTPEPLTLFRRHANTVTRSGLAPSLKEKIRLARKSVADDTAGWYAELYRQLIERLGNRISPEMASLLEKRRLHSLRRSKMSRSFWKRLPEVMRETFNGNYFRFGRSWQNIVQDLFFR